jgi:hypothetical protein
MCLDRVAPIRRGRPMTFDIGPLNSAADIAAAQLAAAEAMCSGQISPEELAGNSGAGCMAVPEARAALAAIGTETIGTAATQRSTRQSFSPYDSLCWS